MARHILFLGVVSALVLVSSIAFSDTKKQPEAVLLESVYQGEIFSKPDFSRTELCTVRHWEMPYYLVSNWLSGNEEYLAYQDPTLTCTDPYPFTITESFMILYFTRMTNISISTHIRMADLTDPYCPVPGDIIAESSLYSFSLSPGLWRIAIPLEEPLIVYEQYFVCYNILTQFCDPELETQDSVFLVTDSVPTVCHNYNLRANDIEYIDVGDPTNEYFTFLGKLLLNSAGIPWGYPTHICGDLNGDRQFNTLDIAYLVDYYFANGSEPVFLDFADLNCDGIIGLVDLILLNKNLFHDGAYDCCFQD